MYNWLIILAKQCINTNTGLNRLHYYKCWIFFQYIKAITIVGTDALDSVYHIPETANEEALVMLSDILPTAFECGKGKNLESDSNK